MTLDYASIGLRIKNARNKVDMTQDSLAEALHISRRHLSLLENGDRGISLELLVDIANVLNVPIAELLADSLDSADKIEDSNLRYILLDCNSQEEKIITQTSHTHIRHSHRFLQASAAKKYQTVVGAWMKCW